MNKKNTHKKKQTTRGAHSSATKQQPSDTHKMNLESTPPQNNSQ